MPAPRTSPIWVLPSSPQSCPSERLRVTYPVWWSCLCHSTSTNSSLTCSSTSIPTSMNMWSSPITVTSAWDTVSPMTRQQPWSTRQSRAHVTTRTLWIQMGCCPLVCPSVRPPSPSLLLSHRWANGWRSTPQCTALGKVQHLLPAGHPASRSTTPTHPTPPTWRDITASTVWRRRLPLLRGWTPYKWQHRAYLCQGSPEWAPTVHCPGRASNTSSLMFLPNLL